MLPAASGCTLQAMTAAALILLVQQTCLPTQGTAAAVTNPVPGDRRASLACARQAHQMGAAQPVRPAATVQLPLVPHISRAGALALIMRCLMTHTYLETRCLLSFHLSCLDYALSFLLACCGAVAAGKYECNGVCIASTTCCTALGAPCPPTNPNCKCTSDAGGLCPNDGATCLCPSGQCAHELTG